jgi:predicted AAA+ superfamily ATPase
MAKPVGSELENVQNALPERGSIRLEELTAELECVPEHVSGELVELTQKGEVALFPVGEHVIIRRE